MMLKLKSILRRYVETQRRYNLSTLLRIWFIISPVIFAGNIFLYTLPAEFILDSTPRCIFKMTTGEECYSCGMSRGFIKSSEFKFAEAAEFNRGAPVLFLAGFINSVIFLFFLIFRFSVFKQFINEFRQSYIKKEFHKK